VRLVSPAAMAESRRPIVAKTATARPESVCLMATSRVYRISPKTPKFAPHDFSLERAVNSPQHWPIGSLKARPPNRAFPE
jgi:hypothetical protein